jgi:hypothetical protein
MTGIFISTIINTSNLLTYKVFQAMEKTRNAYTNEVVKAFAKCQMKATKEPEGYHYDRDAQIPGDRSPSD